MFSAHRTQRPRCSPSCLLSGVSSPVHHAHGLIGSFMCGPPFPEDGSSPVSPARTFRRTAWTSDPRTATRSSPRRCCRSIVRSRRRIPADGCTFAFRIHGRPRCCWKALQCSICIPQAPPACSCPGILPRRVQPVLHRRCGVLEQGAGRSVLGGHEADRPIVVVKAVVLPAPYAPVARVFPAHRRVCAHTCGNPLQPGLGVMPQVPCAPLAPSVVVEHAGIPFRR